MMNFVLKQLAVTTMILYAAILCPGANMSFQSVGWKPADKLGRTLPNLWSPQNVRSLREPQHVVWERELSGNEKLWYQYRAVAVTKNGEVLIALTTDNPPTQNSPQSKQIVLWRLRQNGEVISETEIKKPPTGSKGVIPDAVQSDIYGLTVLENGDALLVVEFSPRNPSVVRVDKTGKQVFSKEVIGPARRIWTSKLIPMTDGNFLLVGHESLDAIAIKIDASGRVLWEKKDDRGAMDLFIDGIATDNGGFLLIGNTGRYDIIRRGDSKVWIGMYDTNGVRRAEKLFVGRYGNIARSVDGGYAVAYDKGTSDNQHIVVKSFNRDLEVIWESQILTVPRGYSDFKIVAQPGGEFVVAGDKDGHPYAVKISADGSKAWTFLRESINKSLDLGLALSNNDIIIVSSIYTVEGPKTFQMKIWAIKLAAS